MLSRHQSLAIDVLRQLYDTCNVLNDAYKQVKDCLKEDNHLPSTCFRAVHPDIEKSVVDMLDEILGDTVASYFLYECSTMKNGGKIVVGDVTYPIKTIDDVVKYVQANSP